MIEITQEPISVERMVNKVKSDSSGCVVPYVGLIRDYSQGKSVLSVEYKDADGTAESKLQQIASETKQKWQINNIAICHRVGKLNVGDINLVIAISAAHRQEGFAASQYAIDRFKQIMPTRKRETYQDGTVLIGKE